MRHLLAALILATMTLFAASCGDNEERICVWHGATYHVGDSWPKGDGCNHCACSEYGAVCTLIYCVYSPGDAGTVDAGVSVDGS